MLRFDGTNFRTYNQGNVPNLHTPWFYDITNASDGGVWATTANTLVHAYKNKITTIDARKEADNTRIICLSEDHSGNL